MHTPPRVARHHLLLAVALMLLWTACASLVPRQGWDPANGPVIPHDNFPADCSMCHTGSDWTQLREDFTFDHAAETGYELRGAHKDAQCLECHNDRGPVAAFAARGCAGCHEDIHRGEFGRSCESCHDESTWRPREQRSLHDHGRFPLTGAHAAAACYRCHPGAQLGNFQGATTECAACHRDDLARAPTTGFHANITSDCQQCHRTFGWRPASFANPSSFPLSGGHAGVGCKECHTTPGVYTGLSTQCSSCHLDDYNNTANPNHAASGIGTDCAQCHRTSGWRPASFPSHPFPISGPHARSCSECHTTGNFQQFSCTHCHDHSQSSMAKQHEGEKGYVWSSPACYQCHPNGRG